MIVALCIPCIPNYVSTYKDCNDFGTPTWFRTSKLQLKVPIFPRHLSFSCKLVYNCIFMYIIKIHKHERFLNLQKSSFFYRFISIILKYANPNPLKCNGNFFCVCKEFHSSSLSLFFKKNKNYYCKNFVKLIDIFSYLGQAIMHAKEEKGGCSLLLKKVSQKHFHYSIGIFRIKVFFSLYSSLGIGKICQ